MKKVFLLALCVLGFILIAAPTAVEYGHQVFLNGQPFAQAAVINGMLVIPVEAVAKGLGGTLTLEDAGLTINGGRLNAMVSSYSAEHKVDSQLKIKLNQAATVPTDQYKQQPANKLDPASVKMHIKGESRPLFKVNRAGTIGRVVNGDGKAWISLTDFAKAFGGTFTISGNLKPGEAIQLNFTKNSNAILIGLL